jgi:hypothetical protein
MKYHKLRIAWSAAWGVVCLLLVAQCVRSYWRFDSVGWRISSKRIICANSYWGKLEFMTVEDRKWPGDPQFDWKSYAANSMPKNPTWYFGGTVYTHTSGIVSLRYWPAILITAALAAMAAFARCRFSLRTLLIGMTVTAIALGWLVYSLGK